MLRKTATVAVAAVLGTGAAIGFAACGENREGNVTFEDGTGTETGGATGTETGGATGTETGTGTETATTGTETSP